MLVVFYVLLAIVVPVGWGLGSAWAYDRWRGRRSLVAVTKSSPDKSPEECLR